MNHKQIGRRNTDEYKNVIYKISFMDCNKYYIGRTGITVTNKMHYHRNNVKAQIALSVHLIEKKADGKLG